jgi:hypothetical protein
LNITCKKHLSCKCQYVVNKISWPKCHVVCWIKRILRLSLKVWRRYEWINGNIKSDEHTRHKITVNSYSGYKTCVTPLLKIWEIEVLSRVRKFEIWWFCCLNYKCPNIHILSILNLHWIQIWSLLHLCFRKWNIAWIFQDNKRPRWLALRIF